MRSATRPCATRVAPAKPGVPRRYSSPGSIADAGSAWPWASHERTASASSRSEGLVFRPMSLATYPAQRRGQARRPGPAGRPPCPSGGRRRRRASRPSRCPPGAASPTGQVRPHLALVGSMPPPLAQRLGHVGHLPHAGGRRRARHRSDHAHAINAADNHEPEPKASTRPARPVSLELIDLRTTGRCSFDLPEHDRIGSERTRLTAMLCHRGDR
jgi:hypothetical protein